MRKALAGKKRVLNSALLFTEFRQDKMGHFSCPISLEFRQDETGSAFPAGRTCSESCQDKMGHFSGITGLEFRQDDSKHGDEAGESSDNIGNGFRSEDAVCAHMEHIWEYVGQRNDDDGLAEQ